MLIAIFIVLLVLKLTGLIAASWWIVFAPMLIVPVVWVVIWVVAIIVGIFATITSPITKIKHRRYRK